MPRPDTGGDAPDANPNNRNPMGALKTGQVHRPGLDGIKPVQRPMQPGPNPIAAQQLARTTNPEAVYASRITGPLAMMRRSLMLTEDPEAKPLADEAMTLITDLREVRRDPAAADFSALETRVVDFVGRVKASTWGPREDLKMPMDRIDQFLTEYHTNPQIPKTGPVLPGVPPGGTGPAGLPAGTEPPAGTAPSPVGTAAEQAN